MYTYMHTCIHTYIHTYNRNTPPSPPPTSVAHEGRAWGRGGYQIFELTSSYTGTTSKLVPVPRIKGGGGGGREKSSHEVV